MFMITHDYEDQTKSLEFDPENAIQGKLKKHMKYNAFINQEKQRILKNRQKRR